MTSHIRLDQPWPQTQGRLLIALPGAGCSPAIFDAVAVDGWTVLAVDWARCGGAVDPLSIAQRLHLALARCTGPVALAGHSTGAAIVALASAMAGPDSPLAAAVLSNTGVHSRNHGDPSLVQRILGRWSAEEQQAFLHACFVRQPPAPLWEALCSYLASLPASALLESVQGLRALDLAPQLGRIRTPTLIAHGRYDTRRQVADAQAQALADGIAHARLSLLPGGHTPMVDCTGDYCAALADFLATAVPGPARNWNSRAPPTRPSPRS